MKVRTIENTFTAQMADAESRTYLKGTTLREILDHAEISWENDVVLAKANNVTRNLQEAMYEDCTIEWLSRHTPESRLACHQTLCLILIRASQELYPVKKILINHSLGSGLYCTFTGKQSMNKRQIRQIKKRMKEIIAANELIEPRELLRTQALEQLVINGESSQLVMGEPDFTSLTFFKSGNLVDYLAYPLLERTGRVDAFDLIPWHTGCILQFADEQNPQKVMPFCKQKKLFHVFHEHGQWETILGMQKSADINETVADKSIRDIIKIAEGLHEKRVAQIADIISNNPDQHRLILIAGPSSSGKTTFAKRLNIQLRVNGLRPLLVSLDDYFLDRDKTPKTDNGDYDFESPRALNTHRLNRDIIDLLRGKKVQMPRFNFKEGESEAGPVRALAPHQPLLFEGIHCLNDAITLNIPKAYKLKIYVSALTQLNVTDHVRVPTSDVRMLRRMVRDHQFRGHSPQETIRNWPNVRQGEERHIFPFQETADIIFNSSLVYELAVLRHFAHPLLEAIPQEHPAYSESRRLMHLLRSFLAVDPRYVPSNSILQEFVGGSSFSY